MGGGGAATTAAGAAAAAGAASSRPSRAARSSSTSKFPSWTVTTAAGAEAASTTWRRRGHTAFTAASSEVRTWRNRLAYCRTLSTLVTDDTITSLLRYLKVGYPRRTRSMSNSSPKARNLRTRASASVCVMPSSATSVFASESSVSCSSWYAFSSWGVKSADKCSARIRRKASSCVEKTARKHGNRNMSKFAISLAYEAKMDRSCSSQRPMSKSCGSTNGVTASKVLNHLTKSSLIASIVSLDSRVRQAVKVMSLFVNAMRSKEVRLVPRYSNRVGNLRCGCVLETHDFHRVMST